jgi:cytoskeletal protein RodZ
MSTVAEQLRQAREAQGLSIHQVAEITKIRTDHIRALEDGNFDVFAAPVYIRGFTRTYATLLKLDVPKLIAELDVQLKGTDKFSEPPPLTDQPKTALDFLMLQFSKLNWNKGAVVGGVIGGVVILIVASAIWRHARHSDPLANLKPAMVRPAQSNSGDTLPLPQRR